MTEDQKIEMLFTGVVPERLDEVLGLITTHGAQFRKVGDKVGFNLDAGAYGVIQFTQRSLEQLWLFGFSGLYALHCYSGVAVLVKCYGMKFDLNEINSLPDQAEHDNRFSDLLKIIENLKNSESEHDFNWPQGVPNPENGRPINIEQAVVYDLVLMATAYVMLHELKHVIFESESNAPSDQLEEEMQCDAFATEMMLGHIEKYAQTSEFPEDKIRMKRSMGIALGNAFLAVATPKKYLAGSSSHPPVCKRWSATLSGIELEENDFYWLYFASLAVGILKFHEINFPAQSVISFKQLAISAIEALESGI